MLVVSFPEADLPAGLRHQVDEIVDAAWPPALDGGETVPGVADRLRHDPALLPQILALVDADIVLATLAVLTKDLDHAGHRFRASGLSCVATRVGRRGRGHGQLLVRHARAAIRRDGQDLGIFTCDRPLQSFYERAGWATLPGTVLVGGACEHPFPSDQSGFDKVTVASFFSARARRLRASFDGARIELYPGVVDKLW